MQKYKEDEYLDMLLLPFFLFFFYKDAISINATIWLPVRQ